jgi:C_GCAxxG_C_C family probable redox protein
VSRTHQAVAAFERDFACSQSVLSAFADPVDLDRDTALRVAAGFGGGLARSGEVCGAVAGAIMALGLRHCGTPATEPLSKEAAYPAVREFLARFRGLHGGVQCRELLGVDIGEPGGLERAREQGLFKSRCPVFVRDAARILEDLLPETEPR